MNASTLAIRGELLIGVVVAVPGVLLSIILWSSFPGPREGLAILSSSVVLGFVVIVAACCPFDDLGFRLLAALLAVIAVVVVVSSPSLYGFAQATIVIVTGWAIWHSPTNRRRSRQAMLATAAPAAILIAVLLFSRGM